MKVNERQKNMKVKMTKDLSKIIRIKIEMMDERRCEGKDG